MDALLMSMPGALRLRSLYPLTEEDGSCPLVYDIERSAILEVPEELQLHIAQALETGDPDEDLLGWLMSADLLTKELPEGGERPAPEAFEEKCAFWLLELEAALRLYQRLRQDDPTLVPRVFDAPPWLPAAGGDIAVFGSAKPS